MTGKDIARARQNLASGVGTTTRRNRVLPAARLPTDIPSRIGKAGPREEPGTYIEVDYALRVLETDNAMTFNYDMMNTPLDGNMRLYLQPRPRDTTAGDANYYASAVKITTTDGLLQTDYQLKLKEAMIRPASGADRVAGFLPAPVSAWYPNNDLVRGPTGVHALVRKPKTVDMVVDGTSEKLTLKPPPYTTPAGTGICPLDEILKMGDPWHGLIRGGTLRLPNGATRPAAWSGVGNGEVFPLIPHSVVPATTADAADVAAGRTWLNYGLLAKHSLYEQSIASGFPAWVYIAPDNSTWRVAYGHVFQAGVWNMQLQFFPLRRVFLTDDKWGGLVQTVLAPINPTPWSYSQGVLYDLDSKGAQAVFVNNPAPHQQMSGAAYLNIQGIPPAATATYTLLIDAAEPGPYSGKLYSPQVIQDSSEMVVWNDVYETFRVEQDQNGDDVKVDVNYVVVDHKTGDFSIPTWPGPPTPFFYVYLFSRVAEGILRYASLVGFLFDAADALKQVWRRTDYKVDYTIERDGDPWDYFAQPTTVTLGGGYVEEALIIGDLSSAALAPVTWLTDGSGEPDKIQPNNYGAYGTAVESIRYSNKVYGQRVAIPNSLEAFYRPPLSPQGGSIYVADIRSSFQPYATYHPITHELVWETTGIVNFK